MAQLRSLSAPRTTIKFVYYSRNVGSINSVSSNRYLATAAAFSNNGKRCHRRSLHTACASVNVNANASSGNQNAALDMVSALHSHRYALRWQNQFLNGARCLHSAAREQQAQVAISEVAEDGSSAAKRGAADAKPYQSKPEGKPQRDPLDVSFNDPIAAFKSKTTWELVRAYMVYMICSSEKLVEHNMTLMKWSNKILGKRLFTALMKATFYGHFVAGEDQIKIIPTLERLRSFGVKPILDYSVEEDISQEEAEKREVESSVSSTGDNAQDAGALPQYHVDKSFADRRYKVSSARTYFYLNEATCERNMEIFIKCLEAVSDDDRKEPRAAATGKPFKFTILHLFPVSHVDEDSQLSDTFRVPDPITGQMRRLISQIAPKEEEMFRNMIRRLNTIVKTAAELDVRIMIDAEQTYFQPAISRITLEMMRKYNKEKAIVFNTYQCYLREAYREVVTDLEQAKRQNFYFGAKLVRGAYMDQERARAQALGYADPVNPNYEATTDMYHKTLAECLRRIKLLKDSDDDARKIGIMVASHNEDTVRFAIENMKSIGISPEDKVICFGQLLGMCDYITFPLGQAGYSAYKYIPYGPVEEVLPYLSRRAQENKGVLKKIKKEKRLLGSEIRRRLFRGQLFYKPKGNYVPI
ncbi:LOW QUALITY PROTEIN: uncharacterized protein Dvir_GJ16015 [Drosophila virilis]|uniref:Proline dehydrogenase n=1 Tax=Drosophila virilis TaxID=7244 RepID=B4MAZ9_DROVI|nr:LOW QUALITY PROTEIN: uncharacterized protein Dvir_GJ16015 [Drosophila virilis]